MASDSLFKRLPEGQGPGVQFFFENQPLEARAGDSIAAALWANGITDFRSTPVRCKPRGAYCMMGVCFDCLVEVDGVADVQACMTVVRDGMVVRRGGR